MGHHKELFDVRDLSADLDEEDQEIMAFFPRRRECVLDDMVLVRRGERQYLERKEDIAIRRKRARAALCGALVVTACIFLLLAIFGAVRGTGRPLGWLLGFESIVIPALLRHIRFWL